MTDIESPTLATPTSAEVTTLAGPDDGKLLAVAFSEPLKAQEFLIASARLVSHTSWQLSDSAIVERSPEGRVRIHQTKDMNPGQGLATGGWFGLLAGWFVMAPLAGAVLGAALGGLWAKLRDIGIDDDEMKRLGDQLAPGEAATFLLVTDAYPTHVIRELRRFDGRILYSSFDPDLTRQFEEALATQL